MTLVALTGRLGSGKDTAALHLTSAHAFTRFAFADTLKELSIAATGGLGLTRDEFGWTGVDWIGLKSERARRVLQDLGHGAREILGPDIWVGAMSLAINRTEPRPDRIVVTDVRYPNEVDWVRQHRGLLIRVTRPGQIRVGAAHLHPTEANIDRFVVDREIVNDGTVEDLWAKVDLAVQVSVW
jgi:hypothetical protein